MKAVRWQIPFHSLKGVEYRIDIYDEGYTGTPVQLTGGETPFTTNEDNSTDFFAPVRHQTGSINIVDSDMQLMQSIMPEDNLSRPVCLVRVSDSSILWQGFISSEMYSQGYTSITKELTLPVISVIEAMDSVNVPNSSANSIISVREAIVIALRAMQTESGMVSYEKVYYPKASWRAMNKLVDMCAFFSKVTTVNEHSQETIIEGNSCKSLLKDICTFLGWTVRESGTSLYFSEPSSNIGWYWVTYSTFISNTSHWQINSKPADVVNMSALDWRGDGHQISVYQGARSVQVSASLDEYDSTPSVPNIPSGESVEREHEYESDTATGYYYINLSKETSAFNTFTQIFRKFYTPTGSTVVTSENFFNHLNEYGSKSIDSSGATYAGSVFCKLFKGEERTVSPDTRDGIMLYFSNDQRTNRTDCDILRMRGIYPYRSFVKSYIVLDPHIDTYISSGSVWRELSSLIEGQTIFLYVFLRIGDYYWNGTSWQEGKIYFKLEYDKDGVVSNWDDSMNVQKRSGYYIPANEELNGVMEFGVEDYRTNTTYWAGYAYFFDSISITTLYPYNNIYNNGGNQYYKKLGTHFKTDISVNTKLATFLHNNPSPSLIMDSDKVYSTSIEYDDESGTETKVQRPEVNLIDRLATYYVDSRRVIELEVDRPSANIPLLNITGYDSKTYVPLSESRDWQKDISTITCFELPED